MTRRQAVCLRAAGGLLAMLGVAFVVDAPDARAGAPGTWSEVQGAALPALSAQFSGVRAADGSLFVAYGASNGDVFVSTVGSNGVRQTTARATTAASSNPRLLRGPDGTLRLLWSNGGAVQSSTAPATGVPWSSPPTTVSPSGSGAGPLGAAVAADGTIFFGQASFGGAFLHRGIDPATPNQPISPDPSGHPGIAIDGSTGAVWFGRVASSSLAVQRVDGTTGAATGGAVIAPAFAGGTATIADPGLYNPLALSGRISAPGIYATYLEQTAGQRLLLWRVGDALPVTAAVSSGSIRDPNLVPAPDGGLWIVWLDSTAGVSTLQVRQLRSDGVTLGPITKLVPPGASGFSSQTLTAVAQADRVDVLVAGRIGAGPVLIYDQQVLAPAGVVTIAGRVTARDGRPIADAPVQACRQGAGAAGICPTTVTDRNGLFSFSGIAPGSYQLTAFAPPRGLFDRTAHVGLSTVAANQHLAGQDITMSGPLPIPAGFGIAGPGLITTVGGVPVIVRNQPVLLIFDLSNDIDRAHISYTVERFLNTGTTIVDIIFRKDLTPLEPGAPIPICEPCILASLPPFGVPPVKPPKPTKKRWVTWLNPEELHKGPHDGWDFCLNTHSPSAPNATPICFSTYIDPSGVVRTTRKTLLPGAKVVLTRATAAKGPFHAVPNGSTIMAPANRKNPDRTNAAGHFGWDVVSGYYRVTASHAGCTDPSNKKLKSVSTRVYAIPPPVTDIVITLRCPPAPSNRKKPAVTGTARAGKNLRCTKGSWRNRPSRYRYAWRRGTGFIVGASKSTYRLAKADKGKRVSCMVFASSSYGQKAAQSRQVKVR